LGIISEDKALKVISNLEEERERQEFFKIFQKTPYQRINDSPTVKHYTEWNEYESLNLDLDLKPVVDVKRGNKIEIRNGNLIEIQEGVKYTFLKASEITINPNEHKLIALSTSLSPVYLKLKVDRPTELVLENYIDRPNILSPSYIEIEVLEGEKLKILINNKSYNSSLLNSVIRIFGRENSSVDLMMINDGNDGYYYAHVQHDYLNDSFSSISILNLRSRMGHLKYNNLLSSKRSSSKINVRTLGTEQYKIDSDINVIHTGVESSSDGTLKAIALDSSLTSIRGRAAIEESGHDSSTSIIGKSIILGKDAKAIVAPMLEVNTGIIKMAKHSASTQKFTDDQIFYLMTRGLDFREAASLIVREFLGFEDEEKDVYFKKIIYPVLSTKGY